MQRSDHDPALSPSSLLAFESERETGNACLTLEQTLNSKTPSSNFDTSPLPRMSRAFSMPLPSQTSHWQHPGRLLVTPKSTNVTNDEGNTDQHFHDLSLELADSVQLAVQTLFQLSPPHVFDSAKEQFSGCAIQIPTPSLSALLTSMKNLNYMSANMRTLSSPERTPSCSPDPKSHQDSFVKDEFDIGETLQSVGDSFGGIASDADVDLVLHHGDAIKHVGVRGDECGVSYALSHVLHQVLATARSGDSIEIGLSIIGQPSSSNELSSALDNGSSILASNDLVICTFDVAHKFVSFVPSLTVDTTPDEEINDYMSHIDPENVPLWRPEPQFNSIILRRLLNRLGGALRPSLEPRTFPRGRRCELSITMERGPSLTVLHQRTPAIDENIRDFPGDVSLAKEPSVDELMQFADSIRGKKVTFYANSRGSFAHHLTRYLTAWGLDISHVPIDSIEETDLVEDAASSLGAKLSPGVPIGDEVPPIIDNTTDAPLDEAPIADTSPSFIIIDDDIFTLRQRLLQYRAELTPSLPLHSLKRPPLATHHRPQSSPSIRATRIAASPTSSSHPFIPVPIVHFTTLGKYKLVKDVIQANIFSVGGSATCLVPEVIVILKPAGPRRILTALHTAVRKPIVDPFFSPIATSPLNSSGHLTSFISSRKRSGGTPPPSVTRTGCDRSSRTSSDTTTFPAGSPLSIRERLEYFSGTAAQKLGNSAASGLVVKSPDGRPAGIFFQPQSRTSSLKGSEVSGGAGSEGKSRSPAQRRNPTGNCQAVRCGSVDRTDIEDSSIKPTSLLKRSFSERIGPPLERSRINLGEERLDTKGKGRMSLLETDQNAMPAIGWKEATQILATPTATTVPSLISASSGARSEMHSPLITDANSPPPPSLVHPGNQAANASVHSPTLLSEDAKLSAGRKATVSSKSPLNSASTKKSSKGVGNNIVPPINVLLVEDNPINQTIVSAFMKKNKIKYDVAWNGKEAVEKWKTGNFHIILMDIQMPVMDGIEATKEIRRLEKLENIRNFPPSPGDTARRPTDTPDSPGSASASTPFRSQVIIVALTASSLQSDRVAALAAGCNDFLTKPVITSWLADKIIEWGSIKALQMWAELRPDIESTISHEQTVQAQAVAERLHVPPSFSRRSPNKLLKDISEDANGEAGEANTSSPRSDSKKREDTIWKSSNSSSSPRGIIDEGREAFPGNEPPSVISPPAYPASMFSTQDRNTASPIALSVYQDYSSQSVAHLDIQSPTEAAVIDEFTFGRTNVCPQPMEVTGKGALFQYLEEKQDQDTNKGRPILLGQRAMEATSSSISIASVQHAPPVNEDSEGSGQSTPRNESNDSPLRYDG